MAETIPTTTIVGYDAVSGDRLFEHGNVACTDRNGVTDYPTANMLYMIGDETYRIKGVRDTSKWETWEIDVQLERSNT